MFVRFEYPKTFNNLCENLFETDSIPLFLKYPAIDVTVHENETVVIAELPGVKKEDIKITFEDRVLTISGERKPYDIPENAHVFLNEVHARNFNRSIELTHDVDADKISAEMKDGILRIVLPKAETAKARTVELK